MVPDIFWSFWPFWLQSQYSTSSVWISSLLTQRCTRPREWCKRLCGLSFLIEEASGMQSTVFRCKTRTCYVPLICFSPAYSQNCQFSRIPNLRPCNLWLPKQTLTHGKGAGFTRFSQQWLPFFYDEFLCTLMPATFMLSKIWFAGCCNRAFADQPILPQGPGPAQCYSPPHSSPSCATLVTAAHFRNCVFSGGRPILGYFLVILVILATIRIRY